MFPAACTTARDFLQFAKPPEPLFGDARQLTALPSEKFWSAILCPDPRTDFARQNATGLSLV
jgi:hypothetical protein